MKKPKPQAKVSTRAPARKRAASGATGIDPKLVEQLAAIVAQHDLSEVVVEHGGLHIRVARMAAVAPQGNTTYVTSAPAPAPAPAPSVIAPPEAASTISTLVIGLASPLVRVHLLGRRHRGRPESTG